MVLAGLLTAISSFSAETLLVKCEVVQSGIDTSRKSVLEFYGEEREKKTQYGTWNETVYRLVYSYQMLGMTGGKQIRFTKSWDNADCGINNLKQITCSRRADKKSKAMTFTVRGEVFNVIEHDSVLKETGEVNGFDKLYEIESEGKAILFDKYIGKCERFSK